MTDRTTINIASDVHTATRDVKDEYNDSWTDVLQFYREHRHEVSINGDNPTPEVDTDAIADKLAGELDSDTGIDVSTDKLADEIAHRVDTLTGTDVEVLARQVSRQLDYAELATQVGEEVEGRMR